MHESWCRVHGDAFTADFLVGERARELMWEAHRRTDLIRFGLYNTDLYLWPYKGGDSFAGRAFPEYKCLFPILLTELASNDRLVQNPGYVSSYSRRVNALK